jgi:predicted dithiol-disulfide oxidoreductase (DUF899 family)
VGCGGRRRTAPYYYQLLEQVPKGRGEDDGPRAVRHDEYEEG